MRVLMIGTVNSHHLTELATSLSPELDITIAGWVSPDLPRPRTMAGVRTYFMRRTGLLLGGAPYRALWLAHIIRGVGPDVVHVHGATELAVAAIRAGGRPLLVTVWGSEVLGRRERSRKDAGRALTSADAFTTDSPFLLQLCIRLGAQPERGRLVGWGVDLDRFRPVPGGREAARARLGLPGGRIILSPRATGALYNTEQIIQAFDMLADGDPDVRLVVKHLRDRPVTLPASRHRERIHMIGHVPSEILPEIYAAADACVSIPSSDSAPRTVWEAMACGCPCVLSELPWLDGMVQSEKEALVAPTKAAEVAASLHRLLYEPGLSARIAKRARELVEREHDAADHRRRWLMLYRELTKTSSASK